jgi:DNA-binding PadR family transcriptional regulator
MEGSPSHKDAREFDAYLSKLKQPPIHLDFTLLTEFERGAATAASLAESRQAAELLIAEPRCEEWLASAQARGFVVRVEGNGDSATWQLTDQGRARLAELRDQQRMLPHALWGPFALAARDGLALGLKTYVAAAPIALIAWWRGLIHVSKWWVPVISAVIPLLLLITGALVLLGRRNRARNRGVRGQVDTLRALGGAYASAAQEIEAPNARSAAEAAALSAYLAAVEASSAEREAELEAARRKLNERST